MIELINGNAGSLPFSNEYFHCVITSPPYWTLRDYGNKRWVGGNPKCNHSPGGRERVGASTLDGGRKTQGHQQETFSGDICPKCGAVCVQNDEIGTEKTINEYIENMVLVAREIWRVLRNDGTLWLNLGDLYFGGGRGQGGYWETKNKIPEYGNPVWKHDKLRKKDLVGLAWRVAFALQNDGWFLRSGIVWEKPNAKPESVQDRPSNSHEYIFLLTKQDQYFYDAFAIREKSQDRTNYRPSKRGFGGKNKGGESFRIPVAYRNKRSVWRIATTKYKGSHYAPFPKKLVSPCIKAGTSEKGCCPKCGSQWERIVKLGDGIKMRWSPGHDKGSRAVGGYSEKSAFVTGEVRQKTTIGFRPTCLCYDSRYEKEFQKPRKARKREQRLISGDWFRRVKKRPGLESWPIEKTRVLDPFLGSGTTLLVARELGRSGVGVDLSMDYLQKNAKVRLSLDQIKAWENGVKIGSGDNEKKQVEDLPLFNGVNNEK